MSVFDRAIKSAKRMIEKYGESVTLKTFTYTTPDSSKPWKSAITTETVGSEEVPVSTSTFFKCVFISPSVSGNSMFGKELLQYLKGTDISTGKIRGFVAGESLIAKLNDVILRGNEELKILGIDTISPNGRNILHVLEFDR